MNSHYKVDQWRVIEEQFDPEMQEASESIFSLGNGRMGGRANFEERYSGPSLQGNYIAGIYYPDKTRVGWWKNGYPEFFAKVLNAPNWIGIDVAVDGVPIDLHHLKVKRFRRELNMKEGYLSRVFVLEIKDGKEVEVEARRFMSIVNDELGAIGYSVKPLGFQAEVTFTPYLDGNVTNQDSNYDEVFWDLDQTTAVKGFAQLTSTTRKSGFTVTYSMNYQVLSGDNLVDEECSVLDDPGMVGNTLSIMAAPQTPVTIYKYVSVVSSMNYGKEELAEKGRSLVEMAKVKGFNNLFQEHVASWDEHWSHSDIVIDGDEKAQQAIRFNIFHMSQTYSGKDERLNIGPKGFTGEKYGGSTYWDTEAYMIPFYLSSAPQEVARNLLIYRYKHLDRAIENAQKLGFTDGAALYPMVTMDGQECHNEWEITFEEIHRNGAIAYAIYNYIRYTGDREYLAQYGLEVLIAISRFWRQRVNWSDVKGKYVILGVTGPNEYENNVNNNWYTNYIARWTLEYTLQSLQEVKEANPSDYQRIISKTRFNMIEETERWKDIVNNLYFPYSEEKQVFLQQDGYMDKEQIFARDIDPAQRPLNQHWSWDRILRSPFIKQADVLQGFYFFEDDFDGDTLRRNFEFYEPRTVHESSLSPCIHSILANRLDMKELAYEMYLRTSRLDIDDYNKEVAEGLHITSMGGTWMSVIYGFGGFRVKNDQIHLEPKLPGSWKSLCFRIIFRENYLKIYINETRIAIDNESGPALSLVLRGDKVSVPAGQVSEFELVQG